MQDVGRFPIGVSGQPNEAVDLNVAIRRNQAKHVGQVCICLMRPSCDFFWLTDYGMGIIGNALDA